MFWDRQTTETAALLRTMADEFNSQWKGVPIKVEQSGGYGEIFRKVTASIQARTLPAMAVSYESMTAEYAAANAVTALDDFVNAPQTGFSKQELDDFYPAMLDANRFAQFGGKFYSFPFAKSVLMMYYNKRLLSAAGIAAPPRTWDEFLAQCRAITAKIGKPAHAFNVDCSTVDAMIFSRGGEVFDGKQTLFDKPEAIAVFEFYATLVKEKLAYQISPGTFDDEVALMNDRAAFTLRTSAGRSSVLRSMDDARDRFGWRRIPQAEPAHPRTVVFGPNMTIFNTTPEQQQAAWAFVKYFTSPAAAARWAAQTGYLPVRQSALAQAPVKDFLAQWPDAREAFDCLAFAKFEPNVAGWQEVRTLVERALTEVVNGLKPPRDAAVKLKSDADAALARHAPAAR